MSLKLGTTDIAGISQNTKYNAHHLLDFKWTDCIMNDVSWLRADTFSWQSGGVYTSAYNHLVQDLQGTTAETETIGSYTVTFYRATDGHKICLADQETTIANIYSETGIAWYYILDTTNIQFKLPRTKYGFEGLRTNVGDKIDETLPNITGQFDLGSVYGVATSASTSGAFKLGANKGQNFANAGSSGKGINFNASWSNSTYQDNAPVQERATQMYLYFYVGDYSQTAIEQTAGLNSELFNNKVDKSSLAEVQCVVETYQNGTSWYRVYSDSWCEQGGLSVNVSSGSVTVNLLRNYTNINYSILTTAKYNGTSVAYDSHVGDINTSSFKIYSHESASHPVIWQACGYIEV